MQIRLVQGPEILCHATGLSVSVAGRILNLTLICADLRAQNPDFSQPVKVLLKLVQLQGPIQRVVGGAPLWPGFGFDPVPRFGRLLGKLLPLLLLQVQLLQLL